MKTNLIVLLATLVVAAVLGPMAMDALRKQSAHTAPSAVPSAKRATGQEMPAANHETDPDRDEDDDKDD